METPSYFSITPASVRYDKNLKPAEKILFGEISALTNMYNYCFAKNSYFAELYQVHPKTISTWINNLIKQKHLIAELIYFEGTKQIKERRLRLTGYIPVIQDGNESRIPPRKITDTPPRKITDTPPREITEDINTSKKNNTSINKERGQKEKFLPPSLSEVIDFFEKGNIKASPQNFFNHWESVGWTKAKGLKIVKWQNLVAKWESEELPKKLQPAVLNAAPKKPTQERQQLIENFKNVTRGFVEQLQADASALETARIKFNQECNHPKQFSSQAIYNEINNYQIWLMVEPHLLSDDSLQNVSFKNFKINFFSWFKKQKHSSDLFSELPNPFHRSPELQKN